MNKLDALKSMTQVVADTGDIEAIAEHRPVDATTNPSLLYKAARVPQYKHLVDDALEYGTARSGDAAEQGRLMILKTAV